MPKAGCQTGVYIILNTENGKRYVGSTVWAFKERWRRHRNLLNTGKHHSIHLQNAWNKYGWEAFRFRIICQCNPENCLELEQKYINEFMAADPRYGYNRRPIAGSNKGLKWSEASRKSRSIAMKKAMTKELRAKLSLARKGRIESSETRARKSAAHRGKSKSTETRANMKKAWVLRKLKGIINAQE